ncbi:MAG: hypothetical protein P8Y53_14675 [Pseudolabrys sp.]
MRLMLRFAIPVARGNAAVKDGTLGQAIENLIKMTKADACYFTMIDGKRGGMIFFEESDTTRLRQINEPMFAALDAAIEIVPVLTLDEMKRGVSK